MPTWFASSEKNVQWIKVVTNDSIGKCTSELYSFNLLKLPPPPRAAILVYIYIRIYIFYIYTFYTYFCYFWFLFFVLYHDLCRGNIFWDNLTTLLMDGLQCLPPPSSWKTHGAKGCSRLDSRLENGRNWAFAEGGAGWVLGCSGRVWSMSLPYCLLMDGFFRNPGRDVYKNPGKSMRFQLPTSTSTGEFARTGFLVAIHRPGWTWRFLTNDSIKIRPTNFKRWKLLTLKGFQI